MIATKGGVGDLKYSSEKEWSSERAKGKRHKVRDRGGDEKVKWESTEIHESGCNSGSFMKYGICCAILDSSEDTMHILH